MGTCDTICLNVLPMNLCAAALCCKGLVVREDSDKLFLTIKQHTSVAKAVCCATLTALDYFTYIVLRQ